MFSTFFNRELKGLAKLGNIVGETLLRMQILLLGNKKCFCLESKTFLLAGHKFCVRNMFPSLATPVNITRNIVSATMFPSLARP